LTKIADLVKTADWKTEKHVPVIDCINEVGADKVFEVKVTIGKESNLNLISSIYEISRGNKNGTACFRP